MKFCLLSSANQCLDDVAARLPHKRVCEEGNLCAVAGAAPGGTRRESIQSESVGAVGSCGVLRSSLLWVHGLEAIPYHLGECIEFVESCGYRKLFKRFRVPKRGRTVSLADNFVPRHRAVEWRSQRLMVPESRLLIDTQRNWW